MSKFLVIQTAFIGDAILATALIEKLHQYYSAERIDLLVRKGNESLFKGHPCLENVYVWNKQKHKYLNLLSIARAVRRHRYDYVVNLQRFFSTGLLTGFSGARVRMGFSENPLSFLYHFKKSYSIDCGLHEVERNNGLIAHLTDADANRPALYPSPSDFDKVAAFKARPYICLAPASVWYTKKLPGDKWSELARHLAPHYTLYFIGAPEDRALCDNIMAGLSKNAAHNLCGNLSLLQSAALMQDARMNYVNDSAPLHLASAVNAPTTAFFCSTLSDFGFGPLSDSSAVAQIESKLYCRPCGIHGRKKCPEGHFRCGREIDVLKYLP